jgi:hypothetical protein
MLEIIKEYVQATKDYEDFVDAISKAFGPENYIVEVVPTSYSINRNNLLKEVLGEDNFDWLMWFMYEKRKAIVDQPNVWIDEAAYVINTLEDLVSICFTKKIDLTL